MSQFNWRSQFFISMARGFTLIELLVVIAIIGLLSSVILSSLDSARGKGGNAAVESDLTNMVSEAAIDYSNAPNSYVNVCTDTIVHSAMINAENAAGQSGGPVYVFATAETGTQAAGTATINCQSQATSWVIQSPLRTVAGGNSYWCVDNSGDSKGEAAILPASQAICP